MGDDAQSTTSSFKPWKPFREPLKMGISEAMGAYNQGPRQYYGGDTIAPQSGASIAGQQGGLDLVRQGLAGSDPASQYLQRTLSGDFLNQMPAGFEEMLQQSMGDVTRQFQQGVAPGLSMGEFGRSGSGRAANTRGNANFDYMDRLWGLNAGTRVGQYNTNQQIQSQAAAYAPQIDASRRQNIGLGYELGQGADRYAQSRVSADVDRFNFNRDEIWERLGMFKDLLSNPSGYGQSTGQAPGQNTGMQAAGLGLQGLGTMAMFSSSRFKDVRDEVDYEEISRSVAALPIHVWQYNPAKIEAETGEAPGEGIDTEPHIGPMAEDFRALFEIGDGMKIHLGDSTGIALAAIKGMAIRLRQLEDKISAATGTHTTLEAVMGG